ncbi:MAG TPA: TetR/AcrR family transcriptional regulator C-terminal domain-containing protein, partial [Solirubrobacteraceae bacterium]|nr:TetR/AcrR family transcriptional regulator C-terminal domain-containing protein [Solirubrobacteraceae bacterium]
TLRMTRAYSVVRALNREIVSGTAIARISSDHSTAASTGCTSGHGASEGTAVRNKRELYALMSEAIMREIVIPADELPDGWREGLAEIARRTVRVFAQHPWIGDHMDEEPGQSGPSVLRHVEQSLAVASRTGLPVEEQLEITGLVDDYVFGYAVRNREQEADRRHLESMVAYLQTQLDTGEFPHLAALIGDDPRKGVERVMHLASQEDRFERGLQRLLDGIELEIERRA